MKIRSGQTSAPRNTEKDAAKPEPKGDGSSAKQTDSFEPARTTKARGLENKSSEIPKPARRTNPDGVAGPETSQRAAGRPQARVRKLVKGLTKDNDFSVADGRKLAKQVQKDGISQKEINQLKNLSSLKQVGKLQDGRERLNRKIAQLVAAGETTVEAKKDRKELLADIKAGTVPKVADRFDTLGMVLDSAQPYKLSEAVQDTNRSQDDHWIDPDTGQVDWNKFNRDPTHVPEKPALTSTLDLHGRQIKIVVEQPPGKNLPTVNEVAESLSRIRPELLAHVKRVELVNENPSNAYMWVNQPLDPGTIEILPTTHKPNEKQRAQSFVHEIGHIASIAGPNESEKLDWTAYEKAIAADKHFPSQYGATNKEEDFAEFANLYEIFRGTAEENGLRKLFPNRYAAAADLLS